MVKLNKSTKKGQFGGGKVGGISFLLFVVLFLAYLIFGDTGIKTVAMIALIAGFIWIVLKKFGK